MTPFEICHSPHLGDLTNEVTLARELIQKHGGPCTNAVKELCEKTDLFLVECCEMVRCLYRDMETERLQSENAKLREYCSELLYVVESNDPDFLHWPELYDELQKLGVEVVRF